MFGCDRPSQFEKENSSETDSLISFYRKKIELSPKNYPSYALLADALLRKARDTGDPAYLAEARQNVEASMSIQPNYTAMKTMASICNYAHRFADAVGWAEKAADASPEGLARDSELSAIFVEAYLGLGDTDKPAGILQQLTHAGKKPDDFYIASARGALYKAHNRVDDAVKAFEQAAVFAAEQNAKESMVWCHAMAAGCYIDSGRADESRPYLEKGKALSPTNKLILIHEAEYLLALKRPQEALDIYNRVLLSTDDPELHRSAFVIERDLGNADNAKRHFDAAVRGFTRILDAGEIYSLGPLAQLYCDQGVELEKAKAFAVRNLEYKRDAEAQQTLGCVKERSR